MTTPMKQLSVYAIVASMSLTACSVVAEGPNGRGPMIGRLPAGEQREVRREERREDRQEERHDDRRDERRHEREDDRRGERRESHDRDGNRSRSNVQIHIGGYFGERERGEVHDYYRKHDRRDKCPPGLAKKRNGCQAPGQARKWSMGRPLPRDVAYQPVEAEIRVKLGTPPAGHEFVRVASDILLIAVGTSIVMDAIQDISGR